MPSTAQHGGASLPEPPTAGWGCVEGLPCRRSQPLPIPARQLGLRAVEQCPPQGWVTPHIHLTGTEHCRAPTPYPGDTQSWGCPQHTARHTSPRHHAGNSTSRQHDRGSTDKPGPAGQAGVRPPVWPRGSDTHGAHSYLPSLSPCHVFSRACPVEAMSEVECGVGGTAWDRTQGHRWQRHHELLKDSQRGTGPHQDIQ